MSDRITANLPAINLEATSHFFHRLGFREDFRDDGWMIMNRGPLELEFFPFPELDPFTSSFSACIRVAELDALWSEWAQLGLPSRLIPRLQGPPHVIAPDLRMFALIDPNGSLLRCLGS